MFRNALKNNSKRKEVLRTNVKKISYLFTITKFYFKYWIKKQLFHLFSILHIYIQCKSSQNIFHIFRRCSYTKKNNVNILNLFLKIIYFHKKKLKKKIIRNLLNVLLLFQEKKNYFQQ